MKIQGIYKIVNKINNKIYIGQSIDIDKRFYIHRQNSINNINHPLYNSIKCYGIDNFEFIIIEEIEDVNILDIREQYYIDHYKSYDRNFGYNLSPTAGGSNRGFKLSEESIRKRTESRKGYKHSEETKLKMSNSSKGKIKTKEHINNIIIANKGRICSKETRKKISLSGKSRKHSEKSKLKMSLAHKGKIKSIEHKRKIGLAHKGKIISEETREKMSKSIKGKKFSKEHKLKISLSLLGKKRKPFSNEWKSKIGLARKKSWNKKKRLLKENLRATLHSYHTIA